MIATVLAVALAAAAAATRPEQVPADIVVVIDTSGPAANAEEAARLRAEALADVERYGRTVYFELTAAKAAPPAFQPSGQPLRKPEPTKGETLTQEPAVDTSPDPLLRRAADYVARFEREFSAALWRERYRQEVRAKRRFGSTGATFMTLVSERQLDSEMLFMWLPFDQTWITVRDVTAVDGQPTPETDRTLPSILSAPSLSEVRLKELAAKNGRFNIGSMVRTFAEPTLALLFLGDQYRQRFTFRRRGGHTLNGRSAVIFDFLERSGPTVIVERENRGVPSKGTLWVDAETAAVLRTVLQLVDEPAGLRGELIVDYSAGRRFEVLVPVEMREKYTSASGEEVTATARYSDFRKFETGARLLVPR